jgi:hypothetical protein
MDTFEPTQVYCLCFWQLDLSECVILYLPTGSHKVAVEGEALLRCILEVLN